MAIIRCKRCGRRYRVADNERRRIFCQCGQPLEFNPGSHLEVEEEETGPVLVEEAAEGDLSAVRQLSQAYKKIRQELAKAIVGQERVIEELLIAMFAVGHCILLGVPGLAKTLLVSTLSSCLSLKFHRIQFTPDLMPSDITGTEVIQDDPETGERRFKFLPGPVFANIILADEINRTPPKTQAALLEAMQERKVSIGGVDYKLEEPFFVLATQNPIEMEGTYPLPEAQLDRFLFEILVDYPSDEEELDIMKLVTSRLEVEIEPVLSGEEIVNLQRVVRRVPVADYVFNYAKRIARSTRPGMPEAPEFINRWLSWGAGPRASLFFILAGKARAILKGQYHVCCDDVEAVALPVLRHRIIPNFTAQSEGVSAEDIIKRLLSTIPKDEKL